ncbi:MAG: hypothetical protein ACI4BD_03140 [Paludibacteraceae bacterium]
MLDFTLDTYRALLEAFQHTGYQVLTFEQYCDLQASGKVPAQYLILRHDVDKLPQNSLHTAEIEHSLGIKATYYFRVYPKQADEQQYIKSIAALGHEIGYHYEDMSLAKGNTAAAYKHFVSALAYLRRFYPVRTICMHGAPTSQWDGKDLWKRHDYRTLGIIGEPYFDTPFGQVFYLTDTGRCWDGYRYSVRDKIPVYQDRWVERGLVFHRSEDIIRALQKRVFPDRLMMTTHPQRWTNSKRAWAKEWVLQNIKNQIKRLLVKKK